MSSGLDTVIITGLSGAGRGTAAKCFEDLGYFVVDNLRVVPEPSSLALAGLSALAALAAWRRARAS